mmetsp:Transcript_7513/g.11365  ORF Transcript_7513/g.11365 Transcript_7513/m.11365 type:complete len:151 (-) Transcript_7513:8-460(-)
MMSVYANLQAYQHVQQRAKQYLMAHHSSTASIQWMQQRIALIKQERRAKRLQKNQRHLASIDASLSALHTPNTHTTNNEVPSFAFRKQHNDKTQSNKQQLPYYDPMEADLLFQANKMDGDQLNQKTEFVYYSKPKKKKRGRKYSKKKSSF